MYVEFLSSRSYILNVISIKEWQEELHTCRHSPYSTLFRITNCPLPVPWNRISILYSLPILLTEGVLKRANMGRGVACRRPNPIPGCCKMIAITGIIMEAVRISICR